MSIEYAISGGQLHFDKKAFTRELLLSNSPLKKILRSKIDEVDNKKPIITKTDNSVIVDYNDASDIKLDENFGELFRVLKSKYKEKMKGKITIRITLYDSYYMILDFDKEE